MSLILIMMGRMNFSFMVNIYCWVICIKCSIVFYIGCFPETWTDGIIIRLHKKSDLNVASNYRGLTSLSTFSKLFTRVISNRLNKWADRCGLIIEAQMGFRKYHSTTDNIFVLHALISYAINNKYKLFCAFIDFCRAFDPINHKYLWYKLIKCGMSFVAYIGWWSPE